MRSSLAIAAVASVLGAAGAAAQGLVAERAFPVEGACYGRAYDAAHLSRQPGQVVATIAVWGSSRSLIAARRHARRVDPELALTLRVVFTDGRVAQGEIGCVEENGRVTRCGRLASCGGDFAVGGLPDGRLRLVNDDASPLDPDDARRPRGFSPDGECRRDVRLGSFVPPDAENRVFLLARWPAAACAAFEAGR